MAITRGKKEEQVSELSQLLKDSKLTVFARYTGLTVAEAQDLRSAAAADRTKIKIVKNRLVKVALSADSNLAKLDTSQLNGQLLYAFNAEDEVAPAKNLADFAKQHPALKPLGGFGPEGNSLDEAQLSALAALPGKDQLRAHLVGTLHAPISGFVRVMAGNLNGLMNVLKARQEQLS